MYTVAVQRDFIAQHFLFGGDWGAENSPHAHHYAVEVRLKGTALNEHGYLVDIVDVEAILDELAGYYRDKLLNALPEFAGINPSIEHFARIFCEGFAERLKGSRLSAIQASLWENRIAWASYVKEF
jgi:6-pyruvoyltetrahydropterin/6-carboxytetrahydropterin synthase